jgi:hypothetical protein
VINGLPEVFCVTRMTVSASENGSLRISGAFSSVELFLTEDQTRAVVRAIRREFYGGDDL